jgi:methylated-DNA-protein-cysteine methyltransferase-like protein
LDPLARSRATAPSGGGALDGGRRYTGSVPAFRDLVFALVAEVPRGRVTSYGRLASALGQRGRSREVGWALATTPPTLRLPAHRVVRIDGGMAGGAAFGSPEVQRALLEAEGVRFRPDGRVDLDRHLWSPAATAATGQRVRANLGVGLAGDPPGRRGDHAQTERLRE